MDQVQAAAKSLAEAAPALSATALRGEIARITRDLKNHGHDLTVKSFTALVEACLAAPPTHPDLSDRMMRYRRNPPCPECDTHPVVCESRRGGEAFFRCRSCGHRWGE